jgi:hypothetical protein
VRSPLTSARKIRCLKSQTPRLAAAAAGQVAVNAACRAMAGWFEVVRLAGYCLSERRRHVLDL